MINLLEFDINIHWITTNTTRTITNNFINHKWKWIISFTSTFGKTTVTESWWLSFITTDSSEKGHDPSLSITIETNFGLLRWIITALIHPCLLDVFPWCKEVFPWCSEGRCVLKDLEPFQLSPQRPGCLMRMAIYSFDFIQCWNNCKNNNYYY